MQLIKIILIVLVMSSPAMAKDRFHSHCIECHQDVMIKHMSDDKKCLLCHSQKVHHQLLLLDGSSLPLTESPMLCGQCHGPIYLDWKKGLHGKRQGKGTPTDRKLACTVCHNPHDPKFKKMTADPPPHKPRFGIEKNEGENENHGR